MKLSENHHQQKNEIPIFKRSFAACFVLIVLFSSVLFNSCSLLTSKAKIIRIFVYSGGSRNLMLEIKDSSNKVIDRHEWEISRTTQFHYNRFNPMQIDTAEGKAYVDVENGKKAVVTTIDEYNPYGRPSLRHLCSLDEGLVIGTFTYIGKGKGTLRTDCFYSDLYSKMYDFDGEELFRTTRRGGGRIQTWIYGDIENLNIIFSEDLTKIRAILPRIKLSEPLLTENIKAVPKDYDGMSVEELGFTFLEIEDKEMRVPYVRAVEVKRTIDGVRILSDMEIVIVYSEIPKELAEQFSKVKLT